MDGDSDIVMVDAPSPPRPPLSGNTSNFHAYSNGPFSGNLTTSDMDFHPGLPRFQTPFQFSKPERQRMPLLQPPLGLSRAPPGSVVPASRPSSYLNLQRSFGSPKNPRLQNPYRIPTKFSVGMTEFQYQRWAARQRNPSPKSNGQTGNLRIDWRVTRARNEVERARAEYAANPILTPPGKRPAADAMDSESKRLRLTNYQSLFGKRPAIDAEESEPKRPRITEPAMQTPVQSPVQQMPGAFPESPEHTQAPMEAQTRPLPAAQNAAARHNLALAGRSIYARIRRITGLVGGAHRAVKQGIRASARLAVTVGQRIRETHQPIQIMDVEEQPETPVTFENDTLAASAQLQADLTEYAQALPPRRYATPAPADPSAQLQAELVHHASHLSTPSTIIAAQTPSAISANVMVQDQPSVQEEIMSEPSAPILGVQTTITPDVQPSPTLEIQPTSTLEVHPTSIPEVQPRPTFIEVETFVPDDEDLDAQRIRQAFDRARGGRPRVEPSPYRQAIMDRLFDRPLSDCPSDTNADAETNQRIPESLSDANLDAEVSNSELAQEPVQETSSISAQEPPTDSDETTPQIEQQAADEQTVAEPARPPTPAPAPAQAENEDEDYDPSVFYDHLPPWRREIFDPEWRRTHREDIQAEIRAQAQARALAKAQATAERLASALDDLEAAEYEQQRYNDRVRRGGPPRPRQTEAQHRIETRIQQTADQLAATTVTETAPVTPQPPRQDRHVTWLTQGINFGAVSAVQWFRTESPPAHVGNRRPVVQAEPPFREKYEAYEESVRQRDEQWVREQQQRLIQQRQESLGRVDIPAGESPVRPLTAEWEQRLNSAMSGPAQRVLATTGDADLTKQKLDTCYTPMAWLNDEVINGHLKYTVDHLRRQANNLGRNVIPKYHAFNSFFYSNLRDNGYQAVSRWSRRAKIGGTALLNVETVFVPVHEGAHWTLLVVSPKNRTIEYFDSLLGTPDSFIQNIKIWLKGELGDAYKESEWVFLNTESPRQDNGSDCGVFLLTTAKAIALGLRPTVYGPRHIRLIRRKIVAELMNGGLTGDFDPAGSNSDKRL